MLSEISICVEWSANLLDRNRLAMFENSMSFDEVYQTDHPYDSGVVNLRFGDYLRLHHHG
jgi:hypothetical protein